MAEGGRDARAIRQAASSQAKVARQSFLGDEGAGDAMRAVVIREHGGPEALRVESLDDPTIVDEVAVVEVSHVGLNHLDVWVRRGVEGHDFHLPRVPGSDVAGTHAGQRVVLHPSWGCQRCARCLAGEQNLCRQFVIRGESADGGCAERVMVPAWQLLPIPDALTTAEASSMPLTLLTAWHMLISRAKLASGERVLVQAGASGVGVMAIQIAKMFGCEVHATASTEAKRSILERLGAKAWPYEKIGVREVDVVVESVGAPTWPSSSKAVRWGGRIVCCGATGGAEVPLNLRALFFKQISILGSTMGGSGEMIEAWRAVESGRIRPVLDSVMSMARIGEAHTRLENRDVIGKIVVEQDLSRAGA